MKYLFCICGFLICFNLSGQVLKQNELDYINYMTDPTHAKVMGSGEVVDEIRAIETSIEEIIVGNGIQLFLTQGNEPNIKVVAQRNALPLISTEVKDKKLIVGLSASLETSKGIKLYVSLGSIASINIKQGSYLNIPNELNFNKLDLLVQSGALADCHVLADNFFCTVMGGSVLNLTGKVFIKQVNSKEINLFLVMALEILYQSNWYNPIKHPG